MKIAKVILAGAIAVASVSAARADQTVYITGATAYRSPAIAAIKNYLSGGFVGYYGDKSGVTSESNASDVAFRGTVSGAPTNTITFKCCWAGSVGGIKLIQSGSTFNVNDQPGAKGWIPDAALPPGNSGGTIGHGTETGTNPNFTIVGFDTNVYNFETGSTAAKADAAFSDAYVSSALAGAANTALPLPQSGATDSFGRIGAIPFDWVVENGVTASSVTVITGVTYTATSSTINYTGTIGSLTIGQFIGGAGIPRGTTITGFTGSTIDISPVATTSAQQGTSATITAGDGAVAPINNITSNQANQVITSGTKLAAFTGLSADSGINVFAFGRNADSGTRISILGESGKGITARPGAHKQPTFKDHNGVVVGSAGTGGSPALVVSALANWPLETVLGTTFSPGQGGYNSGGDLADALLAPGATVAPTPAWTIGYLGRTDSQRACASTFGLNTAKRLTFNGQQDWVGAGNAINPDGTPIGGYNDDAIRQGSYQAWEYEHFYANAGSVSAKGSILDALANAIKTTTPPAAGTVLFSTLVATKTVEGGPIGHP